MLNAGAYISCTFRHILTQDKCGCLSESMISLLKAPSVQRNVKKCLENASFEKLIVLPSSGTKKCQSFVDMNMYVCAEKLI